MTDFTREILLAAIDKIDSEPQLKNNRSSSTYDLIFNNKKYPPILVLSVANQLNGGAELYLKDFNNSIEEPFNILRNLKFEIQNKIIPMKNEFKTWLKKSFKDTSGASSSYIRSLELLSESYVENGIISTKSIFDITDIDIIEKLYKEALLIQKDKSSYIYRSDKTSYGDDGYFSASLNKYKEFLTHKNLKIEQVENDERNVEKIINIFSYKTFHKKTEEAGLLFSEKMVARFVASLCTKPFVICSGLSGSGKTKLAQAFVQWICESEAQYKIIPVGADWTNREPLLGFPNGLDDKKYVKPDSGALDIITDALNPDNEKKPYFLILDEMNLSHVERYFADFLSIMESKDKIKLYSGERENIPEEIRWPKNLFIIGTVNIDETTYMFSPKVLDRANVIEFRISEDDLRKYLNSDTELDMDKFLEDDKKTGSGANMGESFLNIAKKKADNKIDITDILVRFFIELQKAGAEFGYRSASEIYRLVAILNDLTQENEEWDGKNVEENELIDIAILQKLLPKLHGSRNKLTKILPILASFCVDGKSVEDLKEHYKDVDKNKIEPEKIIYKLSFEKISRMYTNAVENGYASYAEA